jgi:hypothetical protein
VLRRIIALSTFVLALTAAPAFAHPHAHSQGKGPFHLYTQMASGSATTSREAGGCTFSDAPHDSLTVSCTGRAQATLVYTFQSSRPVHGQAMGWASAWGGAHASATSKGSGHTIRLTVSVWGGTTTLGSVCVSYYSS